MIECHLKVRGGQLTFKLTSETAKGIFKDVAAVQEVFEAETECGLCRSTAIRFRIRHAKKGNQVYDYHELKCIKCWATFEFGVLNDGSGNLFPKRKSDDGGFMPNRGWFKYDSAASDQADPGDEPPQDRPPAAQRAPNSQPWPEHQHARQTAPQAGTAQDAGSLTYEFDGEPPPPRRGRY